MVADVQHIFVKSHGIFLSPISRSNRPKLRLLYECAAIALLMVHSGGLAVNENGDSIVDQLIMDYDQRSGFIAGSTTEVRRFQQERLKVNC